MHIVGMLKGTARPFKETEEALFPFWFGNHIIVARSPIIITEGLFLICAIEQAKGRKELLINTFNHS